MNWRPLLHLLLTTIIFLPLTASAQWSSDPLQNLGVAVATGEQVIPKIAATSDSGCYISWFDSRSGRYGVYLQRLNAAGEPQWAANGLLISNHPQSTSLVDYDMKVDPFNNAVVVFTDLRNGTANDLDVFAYKISSAGEFLWGPNGIGLSPAVNSDYEANPKVAPTAAGNFVFAWLKSGTANVVTFQRLSAGGLKMWGENGITLTGATGHSLSAPDVVGADNDNVVALWKNSTGQPWAPTTWLYSQKFDPSGNQLWTSGGVLIYNQGHISAWTYPEIIPDEAGGAFYTWYDSPSLSDFSVSVQHVNSAGSLVFPLNGVLASTYSGQLHMNPSITYPPVSDALYVFWTESDLNQVQYGVYGQKFNAQGVRQWTDSGRQFVPLSGNQISFVRSAPEGSNLYVGYFEAPEVLTNAVKAFKTDGNGNLAWGPMLLSAASLGGKDDLEMVANQENRAFLTWSDGRNDFADIYAQNVNPNGTLGNPTAPVVEITLSPINPPIQIPATGGSFNFNATLTNSSSSPQTFDVWIMVQLPSSSWYGPVLGPITLTLPASGSITRQRTQNVPGSAPTGQYWYEGRVGNYPSTIIDTSGFAFTKLGARGLGLGAGNWINGGESFEAWMTQISVVLPEAFSLEQNYPNPFNPTTVVRYKMQEARQVNLRIYDSAGRLVTTLVEGWREAGTHELTFDAGDLPSGVYFCRIQAGDFSARQKMVLVK